MTPIAEAAEWTRLVTNAAQLLLILGIAWCFRPSFSRDPRAPLRAIGWRMVGAIVDHGASLAGRRIGEEVAAPIARLAVRVDDIEARTGIIQASVAKIEAGVSILLGRNASPMRGRRWNDQTPADDATGEAPATTRARPTLVPPPPSRRGPDDTRG